MPFPAGSEAESLRLNQGKETVFIGGYAGLTGHDRQFVDRVFEQALAAGFPVDFEMYEPVENSLALFLYIGEQVLRRKPGNLYNRISCTRLTGIGGSVNEDTLIRCAACLAKANIHAICTPTNDLAFDRGGRRGLSRLRLLLDAGVNISIASGHIRDAFCPFGRGDLLEEALLAAQLNKFGTDSDLRRIFDMITYNPARALMLDGYGVLPGCRADLLILDAGSPEEAIRSQIKKRVLIRNGKPAGLGA
jgi:cytosine deaminase